MEPLLAEEALRTNGHTMTADQLRDAMFVATGDANAANHAAAVRRLAETRDRADV